ncbi:MAG: neutral/alkaline non-lysosomal ceramidase N-terminal domain-containing protein [Oscillospiraceae bacterium]|nr:neutral/alkaline non-lysosomal ceramidase N-terminal domain-containing protein [Oscillospiraceae bacterium]
MRRIISFLLVAVLCMGLFGCGETKQTKVSETFCVGYAKADITPIDPVPLGGYGDHEERISKGFLETLYATCVAFSDAEGEKLLLISVDLSGCRDEVFTPLRKQIAEENGIPVSHVLFTASHSHSSPHLPSVSKSYISMIQKNIASGATAALADLAPATMETGFDRVDRLNTNRHYLLTNGKYQGREVGTLPKSEIVGHYDKADNLLQVVKFTRAGEKKPVVLVNWTGHPTGMKNEKYYYASPNYIGVLRTTLEQSHGCEVSFVLSGSGNVNNGSQFSADLDYDAGDYITLGQTLGKHAGEILDSKLSSGKADNIILSENLFQAKDKSGINQEVPLYAFSVGDWACVTAPFEIFDTNAVAVRDASDFAMTFYASCSNNAMGYLPTPASFDWEITYEAEITKFPKGMAETVQQQLTDQLAEIFAKSGNEKTEKREGYLSTPFVPQSDGLVYQNPAPGNWAQCMEVNNGFYSIVLLTGSSFKTMLCLDKSVAEKVVAAGTMQLVFNEQSVIVDVIPQ